MKMIPVIALKWKPHPSKEHQVQAWSDFEEKPGQVNLAFDILIKEQIFIEGVICWSSLENQFASWEKFWHCG